MVTLSKSAPALCATFPLAVLSLDLSWRWCLISRSTPLFALLEIDLTHPLEVQVSSHLKWDCVSVFHQRIPPPSCPVS